MAGPDLVVIGPDLRLPVAGRGDENSEPDASAIDTRPYLLELLRGTGASVATLELSYAHLDLIGSLDPGAIAFNLCDGIGRDGYPGIEVLEALEETGLAYTGARKPFFLLGSDKHATREVLDRAGVPIPWGCTLASPEAPLPPDPPWPLIVKPRDSFGSVGIDVGSVVATEASLRNRLRQAVPCYGSVVVEAYLEGPELSVPVLGDAHDPHVLPPVGLRFGDAFPPDRRILTWSAKHDPRSPLYREYAVEAPAAVGRDVLELAQERARAAYVALQGSGHGRIDMRCGPDGPAVLEANPNPALEFFQDQRHADLLQRSLDAAGWSEERYLEELIARAR